LVNFHEAEKPTAMNLARTDSHAPTEIVPLTPVFRQSPEKQTRISLSENEKLPTENAGCSSSDCETKPAYSSSALKTPETFEDPHRSKNKKSNSDLIDTFI
jgi:hypothetical protein